MPSFFGKLKLVQNNYHEILSGHTIYGHGMAWGAWHGMVYDMAWRGMTWYMVCHGWNGMVRPGGHAMVYGIIWREWLSKRYGLAGMA